MRQNKKKKKKHAIDIVISMHFPAIGANFFSLLPAAHYCFPFLGLPAAGWPTKIPVPGPCDIRAPTVWPVSARNCCEKSLQRWCSNWVSGLPREAFCRELALGRYVPVLHLSTYPSKCLAILFLFWKDAQTLENLKFGIPFLLMSKKYIQWNLNAAWFFCLFFFFTNTC